MMSRFDDVSEWASDKDSEQRTAAEPRFARDSRVPRARSFLAARAGL
jgi:hypothetical protein